jgi:KipI family sensor histidine kinase inhibitor
VIPKLVPLGDAAVLVDLAGPDDESTEERVHGLAMAVDRLHAADPRFGRAVPGFSTVLVPVDPLDPGVEGAIERLRELVDEAGAVPRSVGEPGTTVELPTRYGGPDGPDLEDVARLLDLRPVDVVELHASVEYRVRFVGFAPGFAYLWRLPAALATPRLATPRERVPAGSVGIAGEHTAVYPFALPGGWRLIGRTETQVWDLAHDPPALLAAGRRVRFEPLVDR